MNPDNTVSKSKEGRSFDTAETVNTEYSKNLLPKALSFSSSSANDNDGHDPDDSNNIGVDDASQDDGYKSSGSGNTANLQNNLGRLCCDKTEPVHVPTNLTDLYASTALSTPNQKQINPYGGHNSYHADCDASSSLSSFFNNMIGLQKNAAMNTRSPWKEDKPFDEESVLESELGEGVEAMYGFGVYTGSNQQEMKEIQIGDGNDCALPVEPSTPATDITCTTMKIDDSEDRKRQREKCICCLTTSLFIVAAIVFGLAIGLRGEANEKQKVSSALGSVGEEFISPTSMPTESKVSSSPTQPFPSASPTSTPQPSNTPNPTAFKSTSPTLRPTRSPTKFPTTSPTNTPTKVPTNSPTASPVITNAPITTPSLTTLAPTICQNEISIDKQCYEEGDNDGLVIVEFSVCDPKEGDWVGVYFEEDVDIVNFDDFFDPNPQFDPNNPNSQVGDDYLTWSYTCGGRQCSDPVNTNRFAFQTRNMLESNCRIVLVPGNGSIDDEDDPPFTTIAMTESFVIAENCS